MLRLRREGQILGSEIPEIILLNSHDGSSSYQMISGMFRFVCMNGIVCGQTFCEVRVPHKGDVVEQVIEGEYQVLDIFDDVALSWRYDEKLEGKHIPLTHDDILTARCHEDKSSDLWTTYQRMQENLIKGGLTGRTQKGQRKRTRAVTGIDGDIRLNRALWEMAEK